MATGKEWEEHFKKLSNEQLDELRGALQTLKSDELMAKEFGDSGLFLLDYWIIEELMKRG